MTDRQKRIEELRKKAILDRVKREAYEVTPQIYAAFAIVLDKWEFGAPDIAEIFAETQEIWEKYADDPHTMCERALEITGIDVRTGGRS